MHEMKFLDGTPVPAAYAERVAKLVSGACDAVDAVGEDELERFAREQERKANEGNSTER
jgi:hypothetical protein